MMVLVLELPPIVVAEAVTEAEAEALAEARGLFVRLEFVRCQKLRSMRVSEYKVGVWNNKIAHMLLRTHTDRRSNR